MATQVQTRRGTTAQNAAFLGVEGEITFDTQTKRLLTHDGVTLGGFAHALLSDIPAAVNPPFADGTAIVKGSVDPTKLLRFEVDGFTTGVTRVLTPPNDDITIAGLQVTNIFTAVQLFPDGTVSAPAVAFSGNTGTGLARSGNSISICTNGFLSVAIDATVIDHRSNSASFRLGASSDVILTREAANTLALRNGVNAQTFNVYNTFTDASNYERLALHFSSNVARLFVQQAGTGTARNFQFGTTGAASVQVLTNSTTRWTWDNNGHFVAAVDNVLDIGASGANRPRTGYFGTSLFVGATKVIGAQGAAVADASGGTVIDIEARAALNALLSRIRTHGLIAT